MNKETNDDIGFDEFLEKSDKGGYIKEAYFNNDNSGNSGNSDNKEEHIDIYSDLDKVGNIEDVDVSNKYLQQLPRVEFNSDVVYKYEHHLATPYRLGEYEVTIFIFGKYLGTSKEERTGDKIKSDARKKLYMSGKKKKTFKEHLIGCHVLKLRGSRPGPMILKLSETRYKKLYALIIKYTKEKRIDDTKPLAITAMTYGNTLFPHVVFEIISESKALYFQDLSNDEIVFETPKFKIKKRDLEMKKLDACIKEEANV